MRGGFVACAGNVAGAGAALERAAGRFRAHQGQPTFHHSPGLRVALLDEGDGAPALESKGARILVAHGAAPAPLGDLQNDGRRFAAFEWDGSHLGAARDPIGLAPLFYRLHSGMFWLATEVAPLLAVAPTTPDLTVLAARAAFVRTDGGTGWSDVWRVPAGSTVRWQTGRPVTISDYWQPATRLATYRGSQRDALVEFRERFQAAVGRCWADRTGLLLSGGLDSSAIAVTAAECGLLPHHTVHVQFAQVPGMAEESFAQEVAAAARIPLDVVDGDTTPWDPAAEIHEFGLPYSWMPFGFEETALTALAARGATVAIDGHDGDGVLGEGFGGEWGVLLLRGHFGRVAAAARRCGLRRAARKALVDLLPAPVRHPLRSQPPTYMRSLERYFDTPLHGPMRAMDLERWRPPAARWGARQLQALSSYATVWERKEFQAARHGLDFRHPFADRDLVEFLISLPCAIKNDPVQSKPILRQALAGTLPAAVCERNFKTNHSLVVHRRATLAQSAEFIRASGVRLPGLRYDHLFEDASEGKTVSFHFMVNMALIHAFAAAARE